MLLCSLVIDCHFLHTFIVMLSLAWEVLILIVLFFFFLTVLRLLHSYAVPAVTL